MNEFIVWCKNKNEWEKDICALTVMGRLIELPRFREMSLKNHTIHNYIGKTDDTLEQNKIYADSSIVECHNESHGVIIGVFTYSNVELRYVFDTLKVNGINMTMPHRMNYGSDRFRNLKVIGTLQEDKHLLDAERKL